MRNVVLSLALTLALAGGSLAQPCETPEHLDRKGRAREGMTVSIGLKLVELLSRVTGGAVFGFTFTTETLDLTYRCTCKPYPPCCPTYVQATIFTLPQLEGPSLDPFNPFLQHQVTATLIPTEERWIGPWVDTTREKPVCHMEHFQAGAAFRGTLGVRVGIGPLMVSFTLASSYSQIGISWACLCRTVEECEVGKNQAPTLSGPHHFTVPIRGSNKLVLTATDPDGAGDIIAFRVPKYPPGMSVERGEVKKVSPETKQATFILSTDAFLPPGPHHLEVEVVDKCNNKAVLVIPVTSAAARPVLRLESTERRDGKYWLLFQITDEDPGERFLVDVEATGGSAGGYPSFIDCQNLEPCEIELLVEFIPQEGAPERRVTVTVTDKYGLTASVSWHNPNSPPEVTVRPTELRTAPGQRVEASVAATDPDEDRLTLTKVSGPGEFSTVTGKGAVQGTYTWTVPPYWRSPWVLVGFRADDGFGGSDLAYLLIRVLQPPRVYGASTWVPRGGTSTTTIYVSDPDSTSHTFSFSPPTGISVRVVGREEPRDYEEHWGGLYYEIEVTADRALCPGTYSVPFTVTDPDGNTASATLTVHVRGNQPPRAHGELSGRAAVTLTPAGVVGRLAWLGPVRLTDPEGDRITLVGLGDPPNFGSANLFIFGSALRVLYQPRVSEAELCQAVREGDVLVDEFTVTLRDACGAEEARA